MPTAASKTPTNCSWTELHIVDKGNEVQIYQLLDTTARHPDVPSSVKQATVKLKQVNEGNFFPTFTAHSKPYEDIERSRPIAANHALRPLVEALHQPGEVVKASYSDDEVLRLLTWQEPSVFAARSAQLEADGSERDLEMYLHYMNRSFTHFAAPLLLMNCPNIETLSYSACPLRAHPKDPEGVYREHLLRSTLRLNNYGKLSQRNLQHLKHLDLHPEHGRSWNDDRYYSHIDLLGELRLFHRLPRLESMSVEYITRNGGADAVEYFPPKSSNLRRIHVRHSMLDNYMYASLIRMSRNLDEFTYTIGGRSTVRGGFYGVTGRTLGKALWDQRASLQKLDLDVDGILVNDVFDGYQERQYYTEQEQSTGDPYWKDEWFKMDELSSDGPLNVWDLPDTRVYNDSIGHLRDFEQLKHLSIGVRLLLGRTGKQPPFRLIDALPLSLEVLEIRGYLRGQVASYDEAIDELLDGRVVKLPALREIHGVEESIPSARPNEEQADTSHTSRRVDKGSRVRVPT